MQSGNLLGIISPDMTFWAFWRTNPGINYMKISSAELSIWSTEIGTLFNNQNPAHESYLP